MSFWEFFFLLLIYVPLMVIWASALTHIFRRDDIGGVAKAIWVAIVILLPFVGTLIYLIVRPAGTTPEERALIEDVNRGFVARYSPDSAAQQLATLADLHDRGKLSSEEFAAEKSRVLGGSSTQHSLA